MAGAQKSSPVPSIQRRRVRPSTQKPRRRKQWPKRAETQLLETPKLKGARKDVQMLLEARLAGRCEVKVIRYALLAPLKEHNEKNYDNGKPVLFLRGLGLFFYLKKNAKMS